MKTLILLIVAVVINASDGQKVCAKGKETLNKGRCCTFPFIYRGHTYNKCTLTDRTHLWCSITGNTWKGRWGWCKGPAKPVTACQPGKKTYTEDGREEKGRCCTFPFIYRGIKYNGCTTKDFGYPFCSITGNYDNDERWGYCTRTERGDDVFKGEREDDMFEEEREDDVFEEERE